MKIDFLKIILVTSCLMFFSFANIYAVENSSQTNVSFSVLPLSDPVAPIFNISVNQDKAYFIGQAAIDSDVYILISQGLNLISCAVVDSNELGEWSYISDSLSKGVYDVVVYVVDQANRTSPSTTNSFEIIYDNSESESSEESESVTVDDDEDSDDDKDDESDDDDSEEIIIDRTKLTEEITSNLEMKELQKQEMTEIDKDEDVQLKTETISKKQKWKIIFSDIILATWYISIFFLPIFIFFLIFSRTKKEEKDKK